MGLIQDKARAVPEIIETQKDTRKERPSGLDRGAVNIDISKKRSLTRCF